MRFLALTPKTGSDNHSLLASVLILVGALAFALIGGAAIGLGAYIWAAPILLIAPAGYLLARPSVSLLAYTGLTLVVSGSLNYFFGLNQFQWALSGLGLLLLCYSSIYIAMNRGGSHRKFQAITACIILWWITVVFGSITNLTPPLNWIVGIRIYLPVIGVFFFIAYCQPDERILRNIILFMLLITSVQWVFCFYQYIAIVPQRVAGHYPGSPWDSVVGTFGGDKFGGGESGSLGVFLSIVVGVVMALHRSRQIGSIFSALVVLSAIAAIVMIEAKVVALLVPLALFLVFRDLALAKPLKFTVGVIVVLALLLGMVTLYYLQFWQNDNNLGLIDAIVQRFAYSFDPNFQASATNLGRTKSLVYWASQHSILEDPLGLFVGHGLASAVSTSSIIGAGTAAKEHGLMLDVTGVSKLLWESGTIGFSLFCSCFFFGFASARRLKNSQFLPDWHRSAMNGVEAAMVLMPLSMFYEVTVVSSPPMQFTAMFLLGYIVYWHRKAQGECLV